MKSRSERYNLRGVFWYSWRDKEGGEKSATGAATQASGAERLGEAVLEAFSKLAKR